MAGLPASERLPLQRLLNKINDQIVKAAAELNACLGSLMQPHRVPGAQPQKILEIIQFQNPGGFEDTDDWAPRIAGGTFPLHSGFEWKQVLDSEDEYDQLNSVGATGWAIAPEIAEKDLRVIIRLGSTGSLIASLMPHTHFCSLKEIPNLTT
jgi:hypothetical protein